MDLEAFLESASPRVDEVTVCARGDLVARHAELVSKLEEIAKTDAHLNSPEAIEVAEAIVAVEEEQAATTATFKFRSIGGAWADLVAEHPPAKGRMAYWDKKTFEPAAVAACSVDPQIVVDQAKRLRERLPEGEWESIVLLVQRLNAESMPRPKLAAATELVRANGRSSTTSENAASPEASSSGGSADPSPSTTTETTEG